MAASKEPVNLKFPLVQVRLLFTHHSCLNIICKAFSCNKAEGLWGAINESSVSVINVVLSTTKPHWLTWSSFCFTHVVGTSRGIYGGLSPNKNRPNKCWTCWLQVCISLISFFRKEWLRHYICDVASHFWDRFTICIRIPSEFIPAGPNLLDPPVDPHRYPVGTWHMSWECV